MILTNPWFLGVAVIGGVALYLIYRKVYPVRSFPFSGTMFIQKTSVNESRWLPLKALFDLIPIIFLAISGANPLIQQRAKSLLIDASLSTAFASEPERGPVFDILRDRAITEIKNFTGLIEIIDACSLESKLFNTSSDAIDFLKTVSPRRCSDQLGQTAVTHIGELFIFSDKPVTCQHCKSIVVRPFDTTNVAISGVNFSFDRIDVELTCSKKMTVPLRVVMTEDEDLLHSVTCNLTSWSSFRVPRKPAQIILERGGYNQLDDSVLLDKILRIWFLEKEFNFLLKSFVLDDVYDVKITRYDGSTIEPNSVYYEAGNDSEGGDLAEFVVVDQSISSFLQLKPLKVVVSGKSQLPDFQGSHFPIGYVNGVPAIFFSEKNSVYLPFNLPKSLTDNQVKIMLLNVLYLLGKIRSDVFFDRNESFPDNNIVEIQTINLTSNQSQAFWRLFVKLALVTGLVFIALNIRG